MITRNSELLRAVADKIDREPSSYDQSFWGNPCGTKHCIAGHAVHIAGLSSSPDASWPWSMVINEKGEEEPTRYAAARLLGLTSGEAAMLFDEHWVPHGTVPEALRAIADGAQISDVGYCDSDDDEEDHEWC